MINILNVFVQMRSSSIVLADCFTSFLFVFFYLRRLFAFSCSNTGLWNQCLWSLRRIFPGEKENKKADSFDHRLYVQSSFSSSYQIGRARTLNDVRQTGDSRKVNCAQMWDMIGESSERLSIKISEWQQQQKTEIFETKTVK